MELKCVRCGKKLYEKKYMIQAITYLGSMGKRMDICKNCFDDFRDWLENYEEENNG